MDIKTIVKNNYVSFSHYRAGYLYYKVDFSTFSEDGEAYVFPVPISEAGEATFKANDKAILFMRYIRQALEDGTFVKV